MTPDEMTDLTDLYVADELPDALRALVAAHLSAHPDAARDAVTLAATLTLLRAAPVERADAWFTERLLDALLREQSDAPSSVINR